MAPMFMLSHFFNKVVIIWLDVRYQVSHSWYGGFPPSLLRLTGDYLLFCVTSVLSAVNLYRKTLVQCFPLDPKWIVVCISDARDFSIHSLIDTCSSRARFDSEVTLTKGTIVRSTLQLSPVKINRSRVTVKQECMESAVNSLTLNLDKLQGER